MTAQEIIQLLNGGFTHDEIIALTQTSIPAAADTLPALAPAPEPSAAPADEPTPAPVPAPAPAATPEPSPDPDAISKLLQVNADLQKQVAHLTSTLQANAIAQSMIPGGVPQQPDAAQTLAQIIRPTRSNKEV